MTGTGSSSAFQATEAKSLSVQFPASDSVNPSDECSFACQPKQTQPLTDAEREDAIYRAGNAMQAWYSHYKATGDARLLDMAYAAMGLQKRLLSERSPEYVAKLERERGLA